MASRESLSQASPPELPPSPTHGFRYSHTRWQVPNLRLHRDEIYPPIVRRIQLQSKQYGSYPEGRRFESYPRNHFIAIKRPAARLAVAEQVDRAVEVCLRSAPVGLDAVLQ